MAYAYDGPIQRDRLLVAVDVEAPDVAYGRQVREEAEAREA